MSGARCCCEPGTWTQLTLCSCGDQAADPHYVDWYTPDMGCGYVKTGGGGGTCWFVGPESPTKASLGVGDVDAGGSVASFVEVESEETACCECCECGIPEASPDSCLDTPVGGCICCPDFGEEDGSEWIWTWQDSTLYEALGFSGSLVPAEQGDSYGTMHYANETGGICDRVLSVDASHSMSKWNLAQSGNPLICTESVSITDCADLRDRFDGLGDRWLPPCGKRLIIRPDTSGSLLFWLIPTDDSLTGDCDERMFAGIGSGIGRGVEWTSTNFDGTTGCAWTGKVISDNPTSITKVVGSITFSGSCHGSRVEWSYVWSRTRKSDNKITNRVTTSGFLEYAMAKAPCPGGCGQRSRFFGVGAIPPVGGGPAALVPRTLGGLLA